MEINMPGHGNGINHADVQAVVLPAVPQDSPGTPQSNFQVTPMSDIIQRSTNDFKILVANNPNATHVKNSTGQIVAIADVQRGLEDFKQFYLVDSPLPFLPDVAS